MMNSWRIVSNESLIVNKKRNVILAAARDRRSASGPGSELSLFSILDS